MAFLNTNSARRNLTAVIPNISTRIQAQSPSVVIFLHLTRVFGVVRMQGELAS